MPSVDSWFHLSGQGEKSGLVCEFWMLKGSIRVSENHKSVRMQERLHFWWGFWLLKLNKENIDVQHQDTQIHTVLAWGGSVRKLRCSIFWVESFDMWCLIHPLTSSTFISCFRLPSFHSPRLTALYHFCTSSQLKMNSARDSLFLSPFL